MDRSHAETRSIERVALACAQCRGRHVKCDATQPQCDRCKREGKECVYKKSRRGGLDKAALARRRLALQQQAERERAQQTEQHGSHHSSTESPASSSDRDQSITIPNFSTMNILDSPFSACHAMDYQINTDRLLDHYYENFHPSTPIVLPLQYLALRRLNRNHGLEPLLSVLHWIGSFYAAATSPEAYYEKARQALCRFDLPRTPLSVQALLLFALGQQHYNLRPESRVTLHSAIAMALELGMNTRGFASQQGEGNPILEESYRRTYYFLHLTDQHFSVISSSPIYRLRDVEVTVDLPCDDEMYEFGQIPPPSTWQDYHSREFAEIEVIYSSMTYLFDIASIVRFIMQSFMKTGTFDDALVSNVDTKLAIWNALLPACKRDPLRPNGKVDEVMFTAHMMATVLVMNTHRPFSSLVYCIEELSTKSFTSPVSFVEALRKNKGAHTARALKSLETETQLLAIPCNIEKHHVFNLCMVCSLTMAQVSACNTLLDDHALSIARDRIRLSIGFISAMSSTWPIAKEMAKEVKAIARKTLLGSSQRSIVEPDPATEIEIPRDELLWPIDTSTASIDIFSGIVLPAIDWDGLNQPSSSSALP